MLPYADYMDLGSSFSTDMGDQKKDAVVSARKRGCNKSQRA